MQSAESKRKPMLSISDTQKGDEKDTFYFGYGSNMSHQQMIQRVGQLTKLGTAELPGYKLVFNKWASTRRCFCANLKKTGRSDDRVQGIVYRLGPSQVAALDRNEGYRRGSGPSGGYKPIGLFLWERLKLMTYQAPNPEPTADHVPNFAYMDILVKGAVAEGLHGDYIAMLKAHMIKEGGHLIRYCDYLSTRATSEEKGLDLNRAVQAGETLLALKALALTDQTFSAETMAALKSAEYKRKHLKTWSCVVPYVKAAAQLVRCNQSVQSTLMECMKQGLQVGVMACLARGARLNNELRDMYHDYNSKNKHPKTVAALRPIMEALFHG